MQRLISIATGPLNPDPFFLEGSRTLDLSPAFPLLLHPDGYLFPLSLRRRPTDLYRPVESSLAAIAFIPPGVLRIPYSSFADDRVSEQDPWLSQAYLANRFRLIHGLKVLACADPVRGFDTPIPDGRLLGKANPTTLRFLPIIKFTPPIHFASYLGPGRSPPPAGSSDQGIIAVVSDMRAMNGFLANPLGKLVWRLQQLASNAFASGQSKGIPEIGMSLQLWLAQDGCKCFAFAHNYFPEYTFYLDGVRLDWDSPLSFEKFDGYDVDAQWRPFLATLLYDALRPFPLRERYPGACGVGWYRSVSDNGQIDWCEKRPRAEIIRFRPLQTLSEDWIMTWWDQLERYVRLFLALREEHQRKRETYPWWTDSDRLNQAWDPLEIRTWRVSLRRDA